MLITISYGWMQYIPVKFSNRQPMLRKKSVQKRESKSITNVEDQITKTKALQQKGFEKNNLNDKNGKELKKVNGKVIRKEMEKKKGTENGKVKRNKKGNGKAKGKVKGNNNKKRIKDVKSRSSQHHMPCMYIFFCFQFPFSIIVQTTHNHFFKIIVLTY